MKVSRRTFLKGAAVTAGGVAASRYLGDLELLMPPGAEAVVLTEDVIAR